jgi:hypothetical protein
MSCSLSELPAPAIRNVIEQARSRCIPGTNKHALVCRTWRDASSTLTDDEKFHLYIDLDRLGDADLAACLGWLQRHGSSVAGLSMDGLEGHRWCVMKPKLFSPVIFNSSLTRLELMWTNLTLLKGTLQQLPALQHLGAYLPYVTALDPAELLGDGSDACNILADVPDLSKLCPRLVSLHLIVTPPPPQVSFVDEDDDCYMHPHTLRLLPGSLQQLRLEGERLVVDGSYCTHLTALGHLTLNIRCLVNTR